jgi:8-oxo-dGTP pyrophosphatase MutT (NUDIX family)
MTGLFERVEQLFAQGHGSEGSPPKTWLDPRIHDIDVFTPAAVLIALTERERPGMLFLHRPSTMRAHAGQVAFPGGRIDPGELPVAAALREAWEELGIPPDQVRVVGATDLYRTGSGYEITPIIGVIPADIEIIPNPAEVSAWFEAPVDFVLDPINQRTRTIEHDGYMHPYVEIEWQGHVIWGITAAIVHNLTRRMRWHG